MTPRPEARRTLLGPKDLQHVRDLGLIARWIVEGTVIGLHRSPAHGFSVEFAEYRQYVPGDDLRYFDWKALGRAIEEYLVDDGRRRRQGRAGLERVRRDFVPERLWEGWARVYRDLMEGARDDA